MLQFFFATLLLIGSSRTESREYEAIHLNQIFRRQIQNQDRFDARTTTSVNDCPKLYSKDISTYCVKANFYLKIIDSKVKNTINVKELYSRYLFFHKTSCPVKNENQCQLHAADVDVDSLQWPNNDPMRLLKGMGSRRSKFYILHDYEQLLRLKVHVLIEHRADNELVIHCYPLNYPNSSSREYKAFMRQQVAYCKRFKNVSLAKDEKS
jgi:hypothetical protein